MLPKVPQSREEVTLSWLQEALKQYPFDILDFSWKGSVGGGINCLSSLERLSLTVIQDGEIHSLSLILKSPPNGNQDLRNFVLAEGTQFKHL